MKTSTNLALLCAVVGFAANSLLGANGNATSGSMDAPPPVILIRNATILTVSHGTIDKGDILIKDGKIAAIGGNLKATGDAPGVDAGGEFFSPWVLLFHTPPPFV